MTFWSQGEICDFKGKEGNSHGNGEANVWKINVCWAILTMGHREDFKQMGLVGSSLPHIIN